MLTYFLLGQRTGWRVNASLLPIVIGLVFCSLSDSSFHVLGFTAALLSNCVDCVQNVLTKRLLNRSYTYVKPTRASLKPCNAGLTRVLLSVSQLQLYTSIVGASLQLFFIGLNWMTAPPKIQHQAAGSPSDVSALYVIVLLTFAGLGFYLQSAFAYMLMSLVSPVTHSVANCVKRALLITLSIFHFGDVVTPLNWSGMALVIVGVYVFNAASRLENAKKAQSIAPPLSGSSGSSIERSTISVLSEIRIDKMGKLG